MEKLEQIEAIKKRIDSSRASPIKALYLFIFEMESPPTTRQSLRDFKGFSFSENSPEHERKLAFGRTLTRHDLESCCKILGLDHKGEKDELVRRVCSGLMNLNSLMTNKNLDENATGIKRENKPNTSHSDFGNATNKQLLADLKLIQFNGDSAYPVELWIQDFESAAATAWGNWEELTKVTVAKQSLFGAAASYIRSKGTIKTWEELKKHLCKEFAEVNIAQLRETLANRKMKKGESVHDYSLEMEYLAGGKIEKDELFQYILDGIDSYMRDEHIL